MFPNLQDFIEYMSQPRPPLTRWQKFYRFVRDDLPIIASLSFIGIMATVGTIVSGLFFIRWLYT
jgi:hypothetical protein